jgi:hypothetical protein
MRFPALQQSHLHAVPSTYFFGFFRALDRADPGSGRDAASFAAPATGRPQSPEVCG